MYITFFGVVSVVMRVAHYQVVAHYLVVTQSDVD